MDEAEVLAGIHDHILDGRAEAAVELTGEGLRLGIEPTVLLFSAMIPALEEVGSRFEAGVYFLPEMLIAARAMQAAMQVVRPHLAETEGVFVGRFVMGTVAGDIHDIGKNLCNVMLEGAGFEVIDLGVNVPGSEFVTAIREHRPDVVGLSAFLTTTMPEIEHTIRLVAESGLRESVKIVIGGAPVSAAYATEVGADGYAPDASSAVRMTKGLLGLE